MSSITLYSAFVLVLLHGAWASPYTNCDGTVEGVIKSIDISKCANNARRCILRRNTNATMTINFETNVESNALKAVVHGVILGAEMPFSLPNPDGCVNSGITCPVKADGTYTYVTTMPISSAYPRVTVDIKWEIKDANNKPIICALIPAKIS